MAKHVGLLQNVPAARLFDEFLKLFQTGHAEEHVCVVVETSIFSGSFFRTRTKSSVRTRILASLCTPHFINTDRRVADGNSVTPMFLLGVFLWAPVKRLAEQLRSKEKMSETQSLALAAYQISGQQQSRISLPRRFTAPMREMLALQPRFDVQKGKRAYNLARAPAFPGSV